MLSFAIIIILLLIANFIITFRINNTELDNAQIESVKWERLFREEQQGMFDARVRVEELQTEIAVLLGNIHDLGAMHLQSMSVVNELSHDLDQANEACADYKYMYEKGQAEAAIKDLRQAASDMKIRQQAKVLGDLLVKKEFLTMKIESLEYQYASFFNMAGKS
jgi:hypothetical protein